MEWLPERIAEPGLLALAGDILGVDTAMPPAGLRQQLYRPGFVWGKLIAFATAQDLLPPLIWALKARSLLPPAPRALSPAQRESFVTTRLEAAYREHTARQDDLRAQLAASLAALNNVGVQPMILKGARYLLAEPGGWAEARPMRDIDLLIRPSDAAAALRALAGIGYVADAPTGLASHHLPELRQPGRHGLIELHTEALAPAGRPVMPAALVWRVAEPVALAGAVAFVLPPSWQALHAMLHHQASDNGYRLRVLALKPLWEFACLVGGLKDEAWRCIAEHTRAHGAEEMLASWCLQAARVFHSPLPAALNISAAARAQAEACFREAAQPAALRRWRFLARQLGRGFSEGVLAERYGVRPAEAGLALRARHAWFLLKRYRGALGKRLFG